MAVNPPHRPTSYKNEYCEIVTDWLAEGKTLASFAQKIGINRVTLWDWVKAHPDFNDSIKKGRDIAKEVHAEQFLLDNIQNQAMNNVVAILYCRNVLKIETKDKHDTSATDKLADALKAVVTTYALPDNGRLNVDKAPT